MSGESAKIPQSVACLAESMNDEEHFQRVYEARAEVYSGRALHTDAAVDLLAAHDRLAKSDAAWQNAYHKTVACLREERNAMIELKRELWKLQEDFSRLLAESRKS